MMPTAARRSGAMLAVGLCICATFLFTAPPAGADGGRPSNYVSVVDSIEPATPTVQVDVVGGDAFLQVTADDGTEVLIPGYDGEPYLRITSKGTVERNRLSPATYLNASRTGTQARFPSGVSSSADPAWEKIGSGGTVAWHDHRIHWMAAQPPTVGADGLVEEWVLPLTVDGQDVVVSGRLLHRNDVFPWAVILTVATGLAAVLVSRRAAWRTPLLLGASLIALALALGTRAADPPGAQASPVPLILTVLALACAVLAVLADRIGRMPVRVRDLVLPLASAAALIGWVVVQIGVLWMPTLPTRWAPWLARGGSALVLGVAVGVALAILIRPVTVGAATRPVPGPAQ